MLSSSYNMWVEILNFVWFAAWFRDKTMSFNLFQIYVRKLHVSVCLYKSNIFLSELLLEI